MGKGRLLRFWGNSVGGAEEYTEHGTVVRPLPMGACLAELLVSMGESVVIGNLAWSSASPANPHSIKAGQLASITD
jgi:hypothetical protein